MATPTAKQSTTSKRKPRCRKKPRPNIAIEPVLLPITGVVAMTGLSETQIRRAIAGGGFPAPKHKCGLTLWSVNDVRVWAES